MKNTAALINDMYDAVLSIESFKVTSYDAFLKDDKTQDAVMYNLIVMGEAANHLPDEYRESHPEIPWASIIGTRNVIVHGYDQVKLQIVWDIIHIHLGDLKSVLLALLQ